MILFKLLSLFLVKSSGFGAVCPMGISSKNSDSGFFSPLSLARHQTLGREVNCGSDKAQEISTIRGKTMLIIKINTNSALMEAWLSSARGKEQDPLPAEPHSWCESSVARSSLPVPAWMVHKGPAGRWWHDELRGGQMASKMSWGIWEG